MNQFQQEIYKTIDILTEEKMSKLGFDKTKRGKVISIGYDSCIVRINGDNYNCKINKGMSVEIDDVVYVKFPQNNEADKYVEAKLGENNLPETTIITAEEILAKLKLIDGAGSGLDADLLDGKHGNEYATQEDLASMEVDISGEVIVGNINATVSRIEDKNLSIGANDAFSKKHSHSNKLLLDGIDETNIETWNGVSAKADTSYVDIELGKKVDKVAGKGLSTEDYSTVDKNKLAGIEASAQVNSVTSVSGKMGDVSLSPIDIGLEQVENKSSAVIRSEITNSNVINGLGFTPENNSNKGSANGYASLDSNSKIPLSLLPDTAKQQTHVVQNIIERDALSGLIVGERSYILSTSDSYIWDGMNWQILAKANWENINLEWSNINGKPQSNIEDIDTAVNSKHTHSNKTLIDNLTQTLVDRWNSAWDHITDVIKHITGAERTLWNSVSTKEPAFTKKTAFNKDFGTTSDTVTQGNDTRLSDARPPTAHNHDTLYNTKSETTSLLGGKSDTGHIHDDRYYTESEINTKLLDKADNSSIPSDTNQLAKSDVYTKIEVDGFLTGAGQGDMTKLVYDQNDSGIVDNSEKVNGFTVDANVPSGALFTDTIYSHPSTHPYSMLTGVPSAFPSTWATVSDKPSTFPPSEHGHSYIDGPDTRANNYTPVDYMSTGSMFPGRAGFRTEFKGISAVGAGHLMSGSYGVLATYVPWTDSSGGYPFQTLMGAGGVMLIRVGVSASAWSTWEKMFTNEQINVAQANTSYTTRQVRNIILSTSNPSGGSNGDMWVKYT